MKRNLLFNQVTAIGKRLAMVLTMLLIVGIGQVWGYTGTFTLVESYSSSTGLENGYYVITASPSASSVKAMGTSISSGRATGQNVSISNKTITNPSDAIVWYIEKSGSTYSFKNVNDNKYIYQSSTSSGRGLSTSTTKQSNWSINTYYSTSPVGFCFTSSQSSNNYLKWNNSSSWFSTYKSGYDTSMTPVALYKLNSATKTLSSISVSGQTTSYNVDDDFSFDGICTAKYSDNSTKTVTPSSVSSPDMSSVGDKTVTISYTEGNITKSATYTITITAPAGGGNGDCDKWVEVDLSDIQSTDDVVIAMEKAGIIWALPNNGGTSTPSAIVINSTNLASKNGIADNLIWNIYNDNGTLTICPKGLTNKWLYCINDNKGVCVGTNTNKTFQITGNYLQHTNTLRYVGVYTTTPDWRCYTSTTSNISGQTLKFYKYVECVTEPTYSLTLESGLSCVTNGSATVKLNATELTNFTAATRNGFTCSGYWSAPSGGVQVLNADGTFAATNVQGYITDGKWTKEGNVTLTPHWECSNTMTLSVGTQSGGTYSLSKTSLETCDCTDAQRQVTITATPNSGYSVTDISYSGAGTATKVSGPTVNGNNTEWVYQFNQGDNGNGTFTVTFTTIPTYTVTWIVDGTPEYSQTGTAGTKLTNIPTPDDCNATTKFVGWTTIPGYSHATIAPTGMITDTEGMTIPVNGATYYAVFAEGEGGGSQDHTITLTADNLNLTSNNGYQEAESTINGFYFLVDKGYKGSVNSKSVIQMKYEEDQNAGLLYNQNAIPNLKSITVNVAQGGNAFEIYEDDSFDENDYGTLLAEPTGTTTQNFSSGSQYFTISVYDVVYFSSIIITYTENEGSSYSNYTTSCSATDCAPTDIQYSSDLNSITVSWNAQSATSIVYLYTDEAGTQEHTHASAEKSHTFTGLTSNTTYYIKIVPGGDSNCASPIIPVKTQIVEMDVIEWKTDGIIVDINTSENIKVVLENEVQYGTGTANKAEDLFFSKYFEGSGTMKLVAIYNGTGQSVSLDNYMIFKKAANQDGNWSSTNDDEYALTSLGSIAHGQEIIFYTRPTDGHLTDCSNDFFNNVKSGKNDNPRWVECNGDPFDKMDFNGNDAIILYKGDEPIDIIGATGTPGTAHNCRGGGSEQGWAGEVTNMDYGKSVDDPSFDAFYANSSIDFTDYTDEDKKEFLSNCGIDIENETINMTTARCILFRDNSVTSGVNTNTGTTFASFTSNEWNGRSVCQTSAMYNAAGFDSDGQATCNSYQDLGSFNYSDYYTKYDPMPNDAYDQAISNGDGTWTVRISNLNKQSCRKLQVIITNTDGNLLKKEQYKVPIMIDENQTTAGPAFIALQANLATIITDGAGNVTGTQNLELDEVREICKECDVVILDNATLTKAQDNTANDHPQVHDVVVYEGGSLVIPDGESYNYTINNLSLRRKGDKVASVQIEGDGELVLPESTPVTLSMRIDATNWHWFTLPYNCNIADVTWSDGTPAKYGTDWFLMWYDGKSRAASTNPRDNHWKKYNGSTIEAGKGYIIGITGNLAHSNYTFELRFPMVKTVLTNEQEKKNVLVNAWGVNSENTPNNNKGWNLVGNPYLNYYQPATSGFKGLPLIKYTEDTETGEWSDQSGDIPYLVTPVNGGWSEYQQELASNVDMLPFTAYFVQVGDPETHTDGQELQAEFNPSNRGRASLIRRAPSEVDEQEEPAIVAVELTNSKGESDKTTLLIADRFTDEYEMNADFFKWFGDYYTYYTKPVLYTIGADNESRAFNALNEQLAAQPVELGMFAAQAGNYTFSLNQRSNLTGVAEVWLHDANSNTHTNLMQDDYSFSTAKTNGAGRFSLSVKMASKVTTAVDNITAQGIWATTQDNQIVINGLTKDLQLWIYDTTGKLLHADHTTNYQHSYSVPTSGVYFVRVNGKTEAQTIKVVVE